MRKGFENIPKSFGDQVSYALRFWQPGMNLSQVFVTQINAFMLFQKLL